ncbi:alkyl hydroperoxide reductase/ Thiol specific antioxidant/ Mal allergen [Thermanaerovibrio acidaminovorans DSM 6589]|jgi:peroxiredoxin|uniref:Alkyl hydroperoxide reductase/ Thiol specific antioxidant/ Mal allergen n=1 Tax=Thermanaerovibrio acidaminovorans (strain ATCC 49978 / DSM 6589 / Su883) TaxID=525903 RepID=D1B999_THEAS|nr:peroxiredoxin [Thermanaerovibrio acidaminovorans]ACZ18852.1 alkyl hydroperoxide reductase/ Thiol specific antioxidant/ Mal allergen [Thermanaerovibrio acidaminovorans DSM 6589]
MTEQIKVGDQVRDFTLKDQDGNDVTLSSLRGKKVLLSFHPLAWTPICRDQMKALDDLYDRFVAKGVEPLGLSVDPIPSKKAWADSMGIRSLKLLSDFWPHGAVADSLGLFIEKHGFSGRANVLVDEEGRVQWVKVYELKTLPDFEEVLNLL